MGVRHAVKEWTIGPIPGGEPAEDAVCSTTRQRTFSSHPQPALLQVFTFWLLFLALAPSLLRAQDRPLDWRFEERLRLGTILGDEAEAFHKLTPYSVTVGADHSIFVLDRGNHRIQAFGPDGEFLRSIGHEGRGPGEFRNPVSIWTRPDSSIAVLDLALSRVTVFSPGGEMLADHPVPFGRGRFMYADGTRELYDMTEGLRPDSLGEDPDSMIQELVLVDSGDTTVLGRLSLVPPHMVWFEKPCRFGLGSTPLFEPTVVWDVAAGRVAYTDSYEYQIDIHSFDGRDFTITRPLEPRRLKRDDALVEIGDPPQMPNPYGADCGRFDADVVLETRGWYPYEQIIERIQIAPDGVLWVSRSVDPAEERATDIFAPDGSYVGTLRADAPYPDAFTLDGGIVVVEKGEFDVEQVVVYAVQR